MKWETTRQDNEMQKYRCEGEECVSDEWVVIDGDVVDEG